jgi:hypothetical protein
MISLLKRTIEWMKDLLQGKRSVESTGNERSVPPGHPPHPLWGLCYFANTAIRRIRSVG